MKKTYLFAAMAACMSLASCNNDENVENVVDSRSTLNVERVGLEGINSRAGITAQAFTNGESLGLYIYRGDKGVFTAYNDGGAVSAENVQYTQGATGWTATQPIVLSTVKGHVYGFYPYAAANTDPSAVAITVAEDQGTGQSDGTKDAVDGEGNVIQYDYMWADPVPNISNASNSVELEMNHALAMVSFQFLQSSDAALTYPGVGQVTKIQLYNNSEIVTKPLKAGASTINIATGAIATATASANGITVQPASATLMYADVASIPAAETPRMLVYPTDGFNAGDLKVLIVVDGSNYTISLPKLDNGYQAGHNYVYTFTMKGTQLELDNVSIKEWIPEVGGTGDIQTPDAQNP